MAKVCKNCGAPISGKNKYCHKCKQERKNQYFKNRYNNDSEFRQKHLNYAKKQRQKPHIGSLYDYGAHPRSNFDDEQRIISNLKNRTFRGRKNNRNTKFQDDSYIYKANKNYRQAIAYEEKQAEAKKACEICGGTDFEIKDGMIICETCGLCEDVFSMSAFGKPELVEDGLTRAMRTYYKHGGSDNE